MVDYYIMKLNYTNRTRPNGTHELSPTDWTDAAMLKHVAPIERNFTPGAYTWVSKEEYIQIRFMAKAHGWEPVEISAY